MAQGADAMVELERLHRLGLQGEHLQRAWVRNLGELGIKATPRTDVKTEPLVVNGVLIIVGWHFDWT